MGWDAECYRSSVQIFSQVRSGLAAVAILLLAGCVSTGSPQSTPPPSSPNPSPAPSLPAGFTDAGVGVALRWLDWDVDDPRDCSFSGFCYWLEVYAYEDCLSSVYVEANLLDAEGRVVGWTNDSLGALRNGQYGYIELRDSTDDGYQIEITDVSCY